MILQWLDSVREFNGRLEWIVWRTACTRYTIVRQAKGQRFGAGYNRGPAGYTYHWANGKPQYQYVTIDNQYCNLLMAIRACEKHHADLGGQFMAGNAMEVVERAKVEGTFGAEPQKSPTKVMRVKRLYAGAVPGAKQTGPGRGRFGCKSGTQVELVANSISMQSKTLGDLVAETGLSPGRVRDCVKWFIMRGHVVENDAGYREVKTS